MKYWTKFFLLVVLILSMLVSNVACGSTEKKAEPVSTDGNFEKNIDEYLGILTKDDIFRGVVLITKDENIVYQKAYGKASEEYNVLNDVDTKFEIGSMTKQFTAASILILAQQKKLDVADKVSKYIPDYPNGDKITIHNLLSQNSGVANYTMEIDKDFNCSKAYKPEEIIAMFKNKPLDFEPGEQFEYSNSNYALLGYIIEKASGKSWTEYVNDNIIAPLGLKNTGFTDRRTVVRNLATAYTSGDESVTKPYSEDGTIPYAAGQMYSNAYDLAKWNDALFSNKVLNEAYTSKMMTEQVQVSESPSYYGYGLFLEKDNDRKIAWHSGSIEGFTSDSIRYLDDKVNVVVLSNNDCTDIEQICLEIGHIYYGDEYEMPKPLNLKEIESTKMEPYLGNYVSEGDEIKIEIVKKDEQLYVISDVAGEGKLFGRDQGTLYWKRLNLDLKFQDLKDNKYSKIIFFGDNELKRVE